MVTTRQLLGVTAAFAGLVVLGFASVVAWSSSLEAIDAMKESPLSPEGEWLAVIGLFLMSLSAVRFALTIWLSLLEQFRSRQLDARPDADLPLVSIIVPAFNEGTMIRAALRSLLRLDYPAVEIIIVDDGSRDKTFDHAYWLRKATGTRQIKILTQMNGGKAHALNRGIAASSGSLVLCVDGDTVLEPQALRHAVNRIADPEIGAVAGCVRVINRRGLWARFQALEYVCGLALPKRAQSAADAVAIIPGPFGLFRREALADVGGYDSGIFAEDFDLTLRVLGIGWHVVYEPRACALTEAPEHVLDLIQQRYRWSRGSIQALKRRSHLMRSPFSAPARFMAIWYLMTDCVLWPFINVAGLALMVIGGLMMGDIAPEMQQFMVIWWLQFVLVDCAVAAYCVIVEREHPGLLLAAPASRVFYSYFLDVWRLMAAIEEFVGIQMNWGSIRRLGRLG